MSKEQTTGKKKSVIQNYGLFWRADRVDWKGSPVSLYGITGNKGDDKVDFREQRGIYALYANYKLVYVGQTKAEKNALLSRLRLHRRYKFHGRWDMFSWFGTRYVTGSNQLSSHSDSTVPQQPKTDVLDVLEGLVIAISEPQLNSQGAAWKKLGITQYYQWEQGDDWEYYWEDYWDEDETE